MAESITAINWNVYGKMSSLTKAGSTITYGYDAGGNRIVKTASGKTTVYVRDASGNVMSVYEKPADVALKQIETHLYGSSRMGIVGEHLTATQSINLAAGYAAAKLSAFTRGEKRFELTNQLGNVLATISDKKISSITEQINSINPKRVERYQQGLKQAEEFIKKSYGDTFDYLFK